MSTVEDAVQRWNTRFDEHKANFLHEEAVNAAAATAAASSAVPVEKEAEHTHEPTQKRATPQLPLDAGLTRGQKKKKVIVTRKNDSELVSYCLDAANAYIEESQRQQGVFQAPGLTADERLREPAESGPVYSLFSNTRSMRDFNQEWQRRNFERAAEQHKVQILDEEVMQKQVVFTQKKQLPLDFLRGQDMPEKMKSLFNPQQRYYNSKIDEHQPPPLRMATDSSHFIAKLLVLHNPSRPFRPCLNSRWGICQATTNMPHPAAPGVSMVAYYSESDYLKVSRGEQIVPNVINSGQDEQLRSYEQLCEFCYRAFVSARVQDSKNKKHRVTAEIPFRYYQVGVGEYSKDGMYQQASLTKSNFSHGIVGNMRLWATNDFIPVMMRFSTDNMRILDCIHVDEYDRRSKHGQIDSADWLPGWREIGPFHVENENNLRQVKETQPYMYTFTTTAREPSVGTMLEDCFEKRKNKSEGDSDVFWSYSHLFRDLYACYEDPVFLQLPHYESKNNRWKYFCVHQFDNPPPEETHKLYYIVLHKVNSLRKIINSKRIVYGMTKHLHQKIQAYLSSYHPLLAWLRDSSDYSDQALLENRLVLPQLGVNTCELNIMYPLPLYHHRSGDQAYYRYAVHRYVRNDPLEVCFNFYSQQTMPPLFRLPYSYQPGSDELGRVVDQLGPVVALESYEEAIQDLRQSFDANVLAIRTFGVRFKWRECVIKKQRKHSLQETQDVVNGVIPVAPSTAHLTPAQAERARQKQRNSVIRTLASMSDAARQNFAQIENWVAERTRRYMHLLRHYSKAVFCEFNQGVSWLSAELVSNPTLLQHILTDFDNFRTLIPSQIQKDVRISAEGCNQFAWSEYQILLTLFLRVAVLEELYSLEPYTRTRIRHNLILLRNSHLKLFRKMFEMPTSPLRDSQLHDPMGTESKITVLEYFYPHARRELHEGCLPNYVNGLEMVNFFADCGMDQFPWSKLQYKMPDRCCDVREYSMMLRNFCQDPTFYRWTMLAMRLSLAGLYSHCTVAPCFARTVSIDELFDQGLHESMKPSIIQFILNNESLVLNAISESLCYQLELMPSLLEMLNDLYRDWFSWRVYANMDMTRHIYSVEGNFRSVWEIVFVRAHLKGMRTLFRLSESDFVVWLCSIFKRADDNRHKSKKPRLPKSAAVSPTIDTVIQNLILQLDPNQTLDARVLRLIGIKKSQLQVLHVLYKAFSAQSLQNMDQDLPPELVNYALNTKKLIEIVQGIPPEQYMIMCHFFTLLKNYQSVRAIKLRNSNVLERQLQRIQERTGATKLSEVPRFAFCCAFSFCCKHVKNSWSSKPGTLSTGYEDIFYDLENDIYVCAKKIHQQTDADEGLDSEGEELPTEDGATSQINITAKRKSDRELRRPVCIRTEPFTVFLPGYLVEGDGFKIPGTKRVAQSENGEATSAGGKKKGKRAAANPEVASAAATATPVSAIPQSAGKKKDAGKKQVFDLPLPGYWITPCCGIPFEYDFDRWTPAGYQCRFCPQGIALYNSFNDLNCSACRSRVTDGYYLMKIYDDVYEMRIRRVVICKACYTPMRRIVQFPLLSLLLMAIKGNLEFVKNSLSDALKA